MDNVQAGILAPLPKLARYLSLSVRMGAKPAWIYALWICKSAGHGPSIARLPAIADAPFLFTEAAAAGSASERIDVNHAKSVFGHSLAADASQIVPGTRWTAQMRMTTGFRRNFIG